MPDQTSWRAVVIEVSGAWRHETSQKLCTFVQCRGGSAAVYCDMRCPCCHTADNVRWTFLSYTPCLKS